MSTSRGGDASPQPSTESDDDDESGDGCHDGGGSRLQLLCDVMTQSVTSLAGDVTTQSVTSLAGDVLTQSVTPWQATAWRIPLINRGRGEVFIM